MLTFLLAYLLKEILFIAKSSFFSGFPMIRNHVHSLGLGKFEMDTNYLFDLLVLFKLIITIA